MFVVSGAKGIQKADSQNRDRTKMIASSTPSVKYSNDKVDNEVEALGKERGSFGDLW